MSLSKLLLMAVIVALMTGAVRLWRRHTNEAAMIPAPLGDDVVVLQLMPAPTTREGATSYVIRYEEDGELSAFHFTYRPARPVPGSPFAATGGTLAPASGSRPAPLLRALARIHDGPPIATDAASAALDVDVGVLGTDLSEGASPGATVIAGTFSDANAGPWTVLKLFLPVSSEEEDPPEIFLALNPSAGEARFLVKEPEYWPSLGHILAPALTGL